ncbi:MAG TPA: tannase/feruloyl esterase family alpha/beta hydrolase [Steroidobacteraceae bacterium]|nr:tannase/feruloyl esterase family alpha/beta hydrolase [Steroidobacteraceae bacterium]
MRAAATGACIGALLLACSSAYAQAFADAKRALVDYSKAELVPGVSCASLTGFKSKDLGEIHAETVAAAGATPAHCRISGTLKPEIAFEVSLPAQWNGRFYMIGNGGHAGESLQDPSRTSQRDAALQMGFAFAQTNTGHDARKEPGATFVLSNPQKAIDYAYRAVHLTAVTAKAITARYYARPVARSYWNSCSNGGRQGLIEAQRYPQDFDGLIVNAPWVSQTGFTVGALWNQRALGDSGVTAEKLALLASRVMDKCDALDGLKDGLIDDPRRCQFDPRTDVPACSAGSDDSSCLTATQADAILRVYEGPRGHGKSLFPGYMPGSEAPVASPRGGGAASAWMNFILPAAPGARAADFNLAEGTMRYLVFTPPEPQYDYRSFDFDRDPPKLDAWARKVDATSTDLTKFRAHGGKLLMTYGWADQVLQPLMGVDYYEKVSARYGSGTSDFFRLFMVPGMTHCSGGNGTDRFDSVTAMVGWVEKNQPPAVLQAARVVADQVVRTRPLCPYPKVARYSGQGSIDEAVNFSCVSP